jgi:hypothetical protein
MREGFLAESQRYHCKHFGIGGKTILKWIFEKQDEVVRTRLV